MVHPPTLGSLIGPGELRELADPGSYVRGMAYFGEGRVELIKASDRRVEATVRGTFPYRVVLELDGGAVDWSCFCPVGDGGALCKHCVAVALTVHDGGVTARRESAPLSDAELDLSAYVERVDRGRAGGARAVAGRPRLAVRRAARRPGCG
jgi:uncharacterized Zn finger protein